jgi:hypothetical protein
MSEFTDITMVAVQVETARTDVWVEDGRSPASYPVDGVPLRKLLAMPPDVLSLPVTTPIAGYGTYPAVRKDDTLSGLVVNTTATPTVNLSTSGTGSDKVVTDVKVSVSTSTSVEEKSTRTIGPTLAQTKFPTPVSAGDLVSFAGRFAIRRTGTIARNSDEDTTELMARVSLWGMSSNTDEYGVVQETATELLSYEAQFQNKSLGGVSVAQILITIPTVSPAVVPAGVTGIHLTVSIIANRSATWWDAGLREFYAASYDFPYRSAKYHTSKNFFTHADANPLRLTVVPKTLPTPGVPAAEWETRTQEQTRLHRFDYEDVTGDVASIRTEKIEADLGVQSIRFVSDTISPKVVAGKRVRVLALHRDGTFTTIVAGTVRTRRIVEDGRHRSQVEIGVHDSHGKLGSTECGVAFAGLAEYAPVLNRIGIPTTIDGDNVTGPSRPLPAWGGAFPAYRTDKLSVRDALIMTRNRVKGFMRLTRRDRLEVLSALPAGIALDVSDIPDEGDMSYSVNAEFGTDTADLINQVSVMEHLLDSEDFDRSTGNEDPPMQFGYMKGRTQTAQYRRPAAIEAYGLAAKMFPVVRGSGTWADIEAGNYGSSFAAWAAAILDAYSIERSGPKSITLPVGTDTQRRLVSKLEVLDAVVVRFRGQAFVRHIRRISHEIDPATGRWKVQLRFDVTGDQVYWLPTVPVPLIALGDTDAGTLSSPSSGLVDGRYPNEPDVYELDGGTL